MAFRVDHYMWCLCLGDMLLVVGGFLFHCRLCSVLMFMFHTVVCRSIQHSPRFITLLRGAVPGSSIRKHSPQHHVCPASLRFRVGEASRRCGFHQEDDVLRMGVTRYGFQD